MNDTNLRLAKIDLLQPTNGLDLCLRIRKLILGLSRRTNRTKFVRNNVLTHFRRQLKVMRKDLGYTQRAMGIIMGVSNSRYSAIENGADGNISLETAVKLADALNCAVELTLVPFSVIAGHVETPTPHVTYFTDEFAQSELESMWINTELERRLQADVAAGALGQPVGKSTTLNERELSRYHTPTRESIKKELEVEEKRQEEIKQALIRGFKQPPLPGE